MDASACVNSQPAPARRHKSAIAKRMPTISVPSFTRNCVNDKGWRAWKLARFVKSAEKPMNNDKVNVKGISFFGFWEQGTCAFVSVSIKQFSTKSPIQTILAHFLIGAEISIFSHSKCLILNKKLLNSSLPFAFFGGIVAPVSRKSGLEPGGCRDPQKPNEHNTKNNTAALVRRAIRFPAAPPRCCTFLVSTHERWGGGFDFRSVSQLYIRVRTGFYANRKTMRLRAVLGDDAFWIPPRLWAYAAENQSDGNFSKYTSAELAALLGCDKYATSILQALKDAEFIDPEGFIHDWEQHNGYHQKYAIRAKTAAAARWSKEKSPTPPKEDTGKRKEERGDKHSSSIAQALLQASEPSKNPTNRASLPLADLQIVFDSWNQTAGAFSLPQCLVVSDKRRRALIVRLAEPFFKTNWKPALDRISKSEFCRGVNERGWRASFDWFISPDAVTKIMEGKYDTKSAKNGAKPNPRNAGIALDSATQSRNIIEALARREAASKANEQPA